MRSTSAEHRSNFSIPHTQTYSSCQLRLAEFLTAEIFFHQLIITHGNRFRNLILIFGNDIRHILRYRLCLVRISQRSFKIPCLVTQNIHGADGLSIFHNRYFKRNNALTEGFPQNGICLIKGCIILIQLIHKEDCRNGALLCCLPCLDRPGLYSILGIHDNQGTVSNRDSRFRTANKIRIPRCIDKVDFAILPLDRHQRSIHGDTASYFLRIIINQ